MGDEQLPLFESTSTRYEPGDRVTVQILWRDEGATVVEHLTLRGHPMVTVKTDEGVLITVGVGRISPRED